MTTLAQIPITKETYRYASWEPSTWETVKESNIIYLEMHEKQKYHTIGLKLVIGLDAFYFFFFKSYW